MRKANKELSLLRSEGRIWEKDIENLENVESDENSENDEIKGEKRAKSYIEMNLGLGVLEEKRDDDDGESSGDESQEDEGEDAERDVLGTLMGKRDQVTKQKVGIEQVEGE